MAVKTTPSKQPQGTEEMTGETDNPFSGVKLRPKCQNTSDRVKALLKLFLPHAGPATALSVSRGPNPAGFDT